MKKDSLQTTLAPGPVSDIEVVAIREQLARILASSAFRSSKRYPDFLRYTVEHAVAGESENIKERVLGVKVFGRDPDYDTSSDPVVRMTAAEVRKRLDQYYRTRGHENEIRIDFPRGSYVPAFNWPQPETTTEYTLALSDGPQAESLKKKWRVITYVAAACVLVASAASAIFSIRQNALDRFWAPIFDSKSPVLLCIPDLTSMRRTGFAGAPGQAAQSSPGTQPSAGVSSPPSSGGRSARQELGVQVAGTGPALGLTAVANSSWPTTAFGVYQAAVDDPLGWQRDEVSFVDAFTVMQVSSALTRRGRSFRLFHTEDATLEDLKQGPAVLIGGTNNPWINQVSSELRFALARDGQLAYISDRQNPSSRQWGVMYQNSPIDYAIVSRIFNTVTGQPVVIAAGVRRAGTEAAGECFSDPNCFAQAEKLAPGDWRHANLQFIVETKVINEVPGQPTVVAAYILQ